MTFEHALKRSHAELKNILMTERRKAALNMHPHIVKVRQNAQHLKDDYAQTTKTFENRLLLHD
ncbi:MAG: hypothetical protein EA374_08510 [Acholeplasmatales bacterium]|nr:MAG: hypothetical protein EA374_08510 [Acholeplasmatales bacterium]